MTKLKYCVSQVVDNKYHDTLYSCDHKIKYFDTEEEARSYFDKIKYGDRYDFMNLSRNEKYLITFLDIVEIEYDDKDYHEITQGDPNNQDYFILELQ